MWVLQHDYLHKTHFNVCKFFYMLELDKWKYCLLIGFISGSEFNFDNLEALESVRSLNDEEFRRLTIARKSLYLAFDPVVNKANQESNSRWVPT